MSSFKDILKELVTPSEGAFDLRTSNSVVHLPDGTFPYSVYLPFSNFLSLQKRMVHFHDETSTQVQPLQKSTALSFKSRNFLLSSSFCDAISVSLVCFPLPLKNTRAKAITGPAQNSIYSIDIIA